MHFLALLYLFNRLKLCLYLISQVCGQMHIIGKKKNIIHALHRVNQLHLENSEQILTLRQRCRSLPASGWSRRTHPAGGNSLFISAESALQYSVRYKHIVQWK